MARFFSIFNLYLIFASDETSPLVHVRPFAAQERPGRTLDIKQGFTKVL
jgi:hypothetical protein